MTKKKYDQHYFEHWYHNRSTRVNTHAEVRRKVALAIATCEYFLRRQLRTVLDIGCGEGAWLPHLRFFRPHVDYTGFDSSDYAVERFGESRNIRKASFGDLPSLQLRVYDLVICSDVMHYVPNDELRAGIRTLAGATDGLAFLEVLTSDDEITGDLDALIPRSASWYRKLFASAGLTFAGPYCWLSPAFKGAVAELESAQ